MRRIRISKPQPVEVTVHGWTLDVFPAGPDDGGGRYDMIRPGAIIETLADHNTRRMSAMPLPTEHELMTMKKKLSRKGWRVERCVMNEQDFYRRALGG